MLALDMQYVLWPHVVWKRELGWVSNEIRGPQRRSWPEVAWRSKEDRHVASREPGPMCGDKDVGLIVHGRDPFGLWSWLGRRHRRLRGDAGSVCADT